MKTYCFIHYYGSIDSRSIFSEIIQSLLRNKLLDQISELHLVITGDDKFGPSIKDLLLLRRILILHQPDKSSTLCGELQTLAIISRMTQGMNEVNACLYLHTKGASGDNIIQQAWRKYMLDFNVGCWENALHKLNSYHLFGVNWSYSNFAFDTTFPWPKSRLYGHFMGNFWWARSDYLSGLPTPSLEWSSRYTAEAWAGLNEPRIFNAMRSSNASPEQPFKHHQYKQFLNALRRPTVSIEIPVDQITTIQPSLIGHNPTADQYRYDPNWDYILDRQG
jgi:hypothetical protein